MSVYVIDSGIFAGHADFGGRVRSGFTTESELINGLDWVIADHQPGVAAVANISIGGLRRC